MLLATAGCALVAHPYAANAAIDGGQAMAFANAQRAANGIPALSTLNQSEATAWCPDEDNGPSGGESFRGFSPQRGGDWSNSASPYDNAPEHQFNLYDPLYSSIGDEDLNGDDCYGVGDPLPDPSSLTFYAFTADGGSGSVPVSETVSEAPTAPQTFIGLPYGQTTGPQILLYALGFGAQDPQADEPFADASHHPYAESFSLVNDATGAAVPNVGLAESASAQDAGYPPWWMFNGGVMIPPVLNPGTQYTGTVTWEDVDTGQQGTQHFTFTTARPPVPVNSTPPSISGTDVAGDGLVVNQGSWSNSPTSYAEQWFRCSPAGVNCQPISGATDGGYTLGSADVGSTIRVQESASNAVGTGTVATSSQTSVVSAATGGGGGGGGGGTPPPPSGSQLQSAPAAGVDPSGNESIFWRGSGGVLWEKAYRNGTWGAITQLAPRNLGSAPAAAVHTNGQVDVFWEGTDRNLWEAWDGANGWHAPINLGGRPLGSGPAVGVDRTGREYVFWRGTGGDLWEKAYVNGRWGSITHLSPRNVASAPAVAVHSNGQVDVFWEGTDRNLWEAWDGAHGWHAPINLGGRPLGSGPSAGVDRTGHEYVFWRGSGGDLWEKAYLNGRWGSISRLSPRNVASAPVVAVHSNGQQDVFWQGTDHDLWESWHLTGWNGPVNLTTGS